MQQPQPLKLTLERPAMRRRGGAHKTAEAAVTSSA
jgi:hypothetical protein